MAEATPAPEATPAEAVDKTLGGAENAIETGASWLWDVQLVHVAGVEITPGRLLVAAIALVIAWLVSWLLRRAISRAEQRSQDAYRRAGLYAVGRIVHYVLLVIGVIVALEMVGIQASKLAVLAGALGVGLGFGLQAIFNNFVSGLILLFDRSLKVGDFVELESGVHGEVRDIQIRATRIVTNDNLDILVPNSEFVSGRVVNWTRRDVSRRMRIPFGVAYGTDKERVKHAALEAAAEVPFTLELEGRRAPQVWLAGFGDSSLDFELVVWLTAEATKRPAAVRAAYNWALESALVRHGLEIPFPQRDLHIRSWPRRGDHTPSGTAAATAPALPEALRDELSRNDALADAAGATHQAGGGEGVPESLRPDHEEAKS